MSRLGASRVRYVCVKLGCAARDDRNSIKRNWRVCGQRDVRCGSGLYCKESKNGRRERLDSDDRRFGFLRLGNSVLTVFGRLAEYSGRCEYSSKTHDSAAPVSLTVKQWNYCECAVPFAVGKQYCRPIVQEGNLPIVTSHVGSWYSMSTEFLADGAHSSFFILQGCSIILGNTCICTVIGRCLCGSSPFWGTGSRLSTNFYFLV